MSRPAAKQAAYFHAGAGRETEPVQRMRINEVAQDQDSRESGRRAATGIAKPRRRGQGGLGRISLGIGPDSPLIIGCLAASFCERERNDVICDICAHRLGSVDGQPVKAKMESGLKRQRLAGQDVVQWWGWARKLLPPLRLFQDTCDKNSLFAARRVLRSGQNGDSRKVVLVKKS